MPKGNTGKKRPRGAGDSQKQTAVAAEAWDGYTESLVTKISKYECEPFMRKYSPNSLLVAHKLVNVRPLNETRVGQYIKMFTTGQRWMHSSAGSVIQLGPSFSKEENDNFLGAFFDGNHRGEAMIRTQQMQVGYDVPDHYVLAGTFSNDMPLELARMYARWVNGAQLMAAGQSFIDNVYGMNNVLDLMLAQSLQHETGTKEKAKTKPKLPKLDTVLQKLEQEGFKDVLGTNNPTHLANVYAFLTKIRNCPCDTPPDPLAYLVELQIYYPGTKQTQVGRVFESGAFVPHSTTSIDRMLAKNDDAAVYRTVFLMTYAAWLPEGLLKPDTYWIAVKNPDSSCGKLFAELREDLPFVENIEYEWINDPIEGAALPHAKYFFAMKVACAIPDRAR